MDKQSELSGSTSNKSSVCNTKVAYVDELTAPQYLPIYKYLKGNWWSDENPYKYRYIRTASIWFILLAFLIITIISLLYFIFTSDPCEDTLTLSMLILSSLFFSFSLYNLSKHYWYPGKYGVIKKKIEKYISIEPCL